MNVTVLAFGSRGDVQPAVALAAALALHGHATSLVAPRNFAALATRYGVGFRAMPIDMVEELRAPETEALFAGGGNPVALVRWSLQMIRRTGGGIASAVLEGAEDADLMVATALMGPFGALLAKRLEVPCVHAWWAPALAARDFLFAASETAPPRLPGWANRALFHGLEQGMWLAMRPAYRPACKICGLPPPPFAPPLRRAIGHGETLLLAYSEALLPRSREWPANVEVTGWWFLDDRANWTPPPELERFLADGPIPIYVGFGSMALFDRDASLDAVLAAVARAGARAVVSAGWGGLARNDLPPSIFALDEAPHDWLFPRMAAIVHHGGAGTTGAALRAGKPSVVTPFITDQHAWARLLFARGLAPAPLPHRALTADALAAAIRTALSDNAMRERAAAIGATVRAENGLANAVAAIERSAPR
ncbi:glycosyltransferase [Roseiarcus sp.]|uniref:glycosyltransferase n=1 Tax=Roseiarcus sp. TaxID=1969460 RepID=UPI003F9B2D65